MAKEKNKSADNTSETKVKTTIEINSEMKANEKPNKKRNYKKESVYDVLDTAMRQFKRQVIQNNETKRECILANIKKRYDDSLRFWLDFNKEVAVFTDSMRFNEYCEKNKHNVLQVAEHIIAEGKTFKNRILSEGFHLIEQMAYMFNGNLFVDTEKIYTKETQQA